MARPFHVEIQESVEYLEKSLHQARRVSQKEKLQMLWWLKSAQVQQHQELAQRLGRNPSTITRWLQQYRQGGISELLRLKKSPGRPPEMDGEMLRQLEERLAQPEGFKSYGEVEQWVRSELGKAVKYKTVHKTVRYRLKAKLKVPRPQSIQQDPQAVTLFKKTSPLPF
uniref:helix-turn-helix domain-containing protein n=1 Tax=Trichocoleus desertorum TaxID=1481672 RepID=UPI0025B35BB9|nr:helix-turn-helix domain-containing protein [Trichocoleus desertorum]